MTGLLRSRAVVASDDGSTCEATIDLLSQCGVTRAVRVRSARALQKALEEDPPDFAILSTPMFDVGEPLPGKSHEAAGPAFIILTDGELQSVHRLMDRALDHRWLVSAILTRPVDPFRLVEVLETVKP
jgi:AmiR/NasT family two-component response regulator